MHPVSQDDQFEMAMNFFRWGFHALRALILYNAGMGSGKTRIMQHIRVSDVTYVLAPNKTLEGQLLTAFRSGSSSDIILLDGTTPRVKRTIQSGINEHKHVVVFFSHIASTHDFGPSAKIFIELISFFKGYRQFCLIDEVDQQLTQLTGGINAKVDHSRTLMETYERILSQSICSLNIFDKLRANRVKCACFSGTMNNMISSKLASMGYADHEITVINVHPTEYLYKDLQIIPMKMSYDNISPYLDELEEMPMNNMGIIAFATEKDISNFLNWYKAKNGRDFSHVKLSSATDSDDLSTPHGIKKLKASRYIIGINMIITGFDLSTHINDRQFVFGAMFRNMSDKISQPLSKNPEHDLYNEVAATVRQFIARLRKGGKCCVPLGYYRMGTFFENLIEVFETIRDGRHEFEWVGPPRTSQVERHAQCLILALKQNLKKGKDRPVVLDTISDLALFDGRDFKSECDTEIVDPYWIKTIELLWSVYREKVQKGMTDEEFDVSKQAMIDKAKISSTRGPVVQRGNGLRDGREVNTDIMEAVRARSMNICAHCSDSINTDQEGQTSHVDRHDSGGRYTKDNLVFSHKGCDASYDNEHRFIHHPRGGVFLDKKYPQHHPDMKQWSCINPSNILARWNWVMERMQVIDEKEFEERLVEKGYTYFTT